MRNSVMTRWAGQRPERPGSATWRNWSGTARCTPAQWIIPTTEDEVVDTVAMAGARGLPLRPAGTGHSFNAVACTDGVLLDLTRYTGVVAVDRDAPSVTVRAGTRVDALNRALHAVGLALPNLSTLAEQTVAGMLATGTHGTGIGYPPFGGYVTEFRLVTPDGVVHTCNPDAEPELFRHARTALGTLGVITTVTVRCVPAFNLRVRERTEPVAAIMDHFADWVRSADHVSFSFPSWGDTASARYLDATDAAVTSEAARRRRASSLTEVRCALVGQAGRVSGAAVPWLAGLAGRLGGRGGQAREFVDIGYRAFTFPQPVRFLSTEYALALEDVVPAVATLRAALRRVGLHSPYSSTVRVSDADDAPLSPAYGRQTGYVNLTVPRTVGYLEILRTAEAVFGEHDGRPHWGKAHTATAATLAPRYPEWDEFQRMRTRLDPNATFTSDHVRTVLGPVAGERARERGEVAR